MIAQVTLTITKRWSEGIGGQWDVYCQECEQGVGGASSPFHAAAYAAEHIVDRHSA